MQDANQSPDRRQLRFFCLFALLAIFSGNLLAGAPVWLIEQGDNKLFLAGTIHLLRPADYPLPQAFDNAYQQSSSLVFEVDFEQTRSDKFLQSMTSLLTLQPGTTLQKQLEASTYLRLLEYLGRKNLPVRYFDKYEPVLVALTLTLLELQSQGVNGQGVDEFFFQRAKKDNKSTFALETQQQQLEFFNGLDQQLQNSLIEQTLDEFEDLETQFDNMVSAWRHGDQHQLETLFVDPMSNDFDLLYQRLLVQRNQNWLPKLIQMAQNPPTEMVLVGSAHLLGSDGLLNLLKQHGFTIHQLD